MSRQQASANGATVGFEATLWAAADALRNNMDAAEYKHVNRMIEATLAVYTAVV